MGQYLQTPNEIAAVEQALSDLVCPTLPEDKIEACIDFVYSNWEAMATALFAYENTLTDICGALGYCTKFQRVTANHSKYLIRRKPSANSSSYFGLQMFHYPFKRSC